MSIGKTAFHPSTKHIELLLQLTRYALKSTFMLPERKNDYMLKVYQLNLMVQNKRR